MGERRRGQELEHALLQAAWDELVASGYGHFTVDAVAVRAGTSRPVLYRRWSGRPDLVRAAIAHAVGANRIDVPDTGSLREDVLVLLREVNATRVIFLTVLTVHLSGYYQETGTSPEDLRTVLARGRGGAVDAVFQRAVERGEVDAGRLTDRMKALPFDLLRNEFLITLGPAPETTLQEIVDSLFLPLLTPGAHRGRRMGADGEAKVATEATVGQSPRSRGPAVPLRP